MSRSSRVGVTSNLSESPSVFGFKKKAGALSLAISAAILAGCGGSSGGGGSEESNVNLTESIIDLSGGHSGEGAEGNSGPRGGRGGELDIDLDHDGNIEMLNQLPADLDVPVVEELQIQPEFGANPLFVTEDAIVAFLSEEPAAGTPYFYEGAEGIFVSDGDGIPSEDEERPTGIRVDAGASLSFEGAEGFTSYFLFLENDFELAGELLFNDDGAGQVLMEVDNFVGREGGSINIQSTAEYSVFRGLQISANQDISNHSEIDANGKDMLSNDGGEGGEGGLIALIANSQLENFAQLNASGGMSSTNSSSRGGRGGSVYLEAGESLVNSGYISANGGHGYAGGRGGFIEFYSESDSTDSSYLIQNGVLTVDGGQASEGAGGEAGDIEIYAYQKQSLVLGGIYSAEGGDSQGEFDNGEGGDGGELDIEFDFDADSVFDPYAIVLTGNVMASGGAAGLNSFAEGGRGGDIDIDTSRGDNPKNVNIVMVYRNFLSNGGNGFVGGAGGDVDVRNDDTGDLTNYIDFNLSGGQPYEKDYALSGFQGGEGGDLELFTEQGDIFNYGDIISNGGDGIGQSSTIERTVNIVFNADDEGNIFNSGVISSLGSNDLSTLEGEGVGFKGGFVGFFTFGEVTNNSRIELSGGDGRLAGGSGGRFTTFGSMFQIGGSFVAAGGNAETEVPDSIGGAGGEVIINYSDGADIVPIPLNEVDVSPGSGATQGLSGCVFNGVESASGGSDDHCNFNDS